VAPPPTSKPGRLLIALVVLLIGGIAWAFWPGTDSSVRLGLDLQGGTQVIMIPQPVVEGAEITEEQLTQSVEIIRARGRRSRCRRSGKSPPKVSGAGAAIVVSVPGVGARPNGRTPAAPGVVELSVRCGKISARWRFEPGHRF
jgi:Preprotein translocase subunit SecD